MEFNYRKNVSPLKNLWPLLHPEIAIFLTKANVAFVLGIDKIARTFIPNLIRFYCEKAAFTAYSDFCSCGMSKGYTFTRI